MFDIRFALTFLFLAATASAFQTPKSKCENLLAEKQLEFRSRHAFYQPLLFSDLDFLRTEAKFDQGPAPQRNVSIVPPEQQFRINGETKSVLLLKKRLIKRFRNRIIAVQRGYARDLIAAAEEQFAMMLAELPKTAPQMYRREGDVLVNLATGDRLAASDLASSDARTALELLGRMVPDDLVFVKKVGGEFHVIGGNLAFPTRWSIGSVLGESITEIHQLVAPTSEQANAFSEMINKVLDRMLTIPDVVRRNNWFLEVDPRYPMPDYQTTKYDEPSRIDSRNYKDSVFLRSERQTLRGLPKSGTVVFGIQPMVFSLGQIMTDPALEREVLEGIKVKLLPDKNNPTFVPLIAKYLEKDLRENHQNINAKVISQEPVNESTSILRVEKPAGSNPAVGEAVRITLNTGTGKVSRVLSLASSPDRDYFEFAVRNSDSDFKRAFRNLKPGEAVNLEFTGTSLHFEPRKPAVMIAAGIGITPFRSFIQYAEERGLPTPMWLLYGNRDHNQAAFETEVDQAATDNSNLDVTHVLSRGEPNGNGVKGRIDKEFLASILPDFPNDAIFYIAGSPEMGNAVETALLKLGIPKDRISLEIFPGYASSVAAGTDMTKIPDDQKVCYCRNVTAGAIRAAQDKGATTLDQIKTATGASTGCGGCACNVMKILACRGK